MYRLTAHDDKGKKVVEVIALRYQKIRRVRRDLMRSNEVGQRIVRENLYTIELTRATRIEALKFWITKLLINN